MDLNKTEEVKPVSSIKRALDTSRDIGSAVCEISEGIFDLTVRPDCVRGNSTWMGDFAPLGIGTVNYMRRMYDAVGLGPELLYLAVHLSYQTVIGAAIVKGTQELLR